MRRDLKAWIGILALVGVVAPFSNFANASSTENNLLIKQAENPAATHKVAFVVSKANKSEKALVVSKANKSEKALVVSKANKLESYENKTHLTDLELKELLHLVGFRGKDLVVAWAVAKKESNGRPLAFNGNHKTGDSSYGMFQINMIDRLGPDRRDKFDLDSNAELFNPVKNAEIAYYMTRGGEDWSSWKGITPRTKEWMAKFPK
jgi:hypothetical protein